MAPKSGRMHPVAAFLVYGSGVLLVLVLLALTTYANISVWFGSATGHDRCVFGVSGLVFEVWGAIGLIIALQQLTMKGHSYTARGLAALALWVPAILFNTYTTQRYFAIENGEKAGVVMTDQTIASQSANKIGELEAELTSIGVVRTPAEIIAERDALPENFRTKRRELTSELGRAERRAEVVDALDAARAAQLASVGSSAASDQVTVGAGEVLTGLGIWIEAFKALGLWILLGSRNQPQHAAEPVKAAKRSRKGQQARKGHNAPAAASDSLLDNEALHSLPANTNKPGRVVEIRPNTAEAQSTNLPAKKTRYL